MQTNGDARRGNLPVVVAPLEMLRCGVTALRWTMSRTPMTAHHLLTSERKLKVTGVVSRPYQGGERVRRCRVHLCVEAYERTGTLGCHGRGVSMYRCWRTKWGERCRVSEAMHECAHWDSL